jgi:CheY-like chemotaxis protein
MKKNIKSKILVVDDSTTNIVLLEAILNGKGYEIFSSQNAKDALQIIKKQKPDLILLDLLMPKISGYDLLKELKNNDDTRGIPVMIVSAYADAENVKRTFNLGIADFINKPIDIQIFVEKVDRILSKS